MGPQYLEIFPEACQISLKPGEALEDFSCRLFDLKSFEPLHDDLQIGIERVGRDRDHPFFKSCGKDAPLLTQVFILEYGFVVDIFSRNIHQCEVIGALVWKDVFFGYLIYMFFDVGHEFFSEVILFLRVFFACEFLEVFQREFGVDRDNVVTDMDRVADIVFER